MPAGSGVLKHVLLRKAAAEELLAPAKPRTGDESHFRPFCVLQTQPVLLDVATARNAAKHSVSARRLRARSAPALAFLNISSFCARDLCVRADGRGRMRAGVEALGVSAGAAVVHLCSPGSAGQANERF